MRRRRQSSIGVNRIRMIRLVGFFFVTFRVLFGKKKFLVCLPHQLFQPAQNLVEMVGNDGYHPLIFEQVSIFGQNALTSIFKCCVNYVTCTSSMMHLISPPKFYITFVLHFSWVLQPSQEKLKTMLMKNVGMQIRCIMRDVQVAYPQISLFLKICEKCSRGSC